MPGNRTPRAELKRRGWLAATAALTVFPQASVHSQIPCEYEIAAIIQGPDCPYTGPAGTVATGISPNGRYVAGHYFQCDIHDEAYVYDLTTSQMITIPRPIGVYTARASGVNDDGLVTGHWARSEVGTRGFVYDIKTGQSTELLPPKGYGHCQPSGIAGSKRLIAGAISSPVQAVLWDDGVIAALQLPYGPNSQARGIDASGTYITGWMGPNTIGNTKGFVWSAAGVAEIGWVENSNVTDASAVNSFGEATGRLLLPDKSCSGKVVHAFLWVDGQLSDIGSLAGHVDAAGLGINNSRIVVGTSVLYTRCTQQQFSATVWSDRGGMFNLNDLVNDTGGWISTHANAISQAGQIAGQAEDDSNTLVGIVYSPRPRNGDVNCDGVRNVDDLLVVVNNWGPCRGCSGDLNGDWSVNVDDLLEVINNWG